MDIRPDNQLRYTDDVWLDHQVGFFPMGEHFDATKKLFVAPFDFDTTNDSFHFRVWRDAHRGTCDDYGFITSLPAIKPRLAFNTQVSLNNFELWLKRYEERFSPILKRKSCTIPYLPNTESVTGTLVPVELQELVLWSWIVKNCKAVVWFVKPNWLMFENNSDAVLFKLDYLKQSDEENS